MDQFTLNKLMMTPQLGNLMKQFRVSKNVTAKTVAEKMQKTAGWISKQEKGVFDSIKVSDFSSYCNAITGDDIDGIRAFIEFVPFNDSEKYSALSSETKLVLDDIEGFVIVYDVDSRMIDDLHSYMDQKSITSQELAEKVNTDIAIIIIEAYEKRAKNNQASIGTKLQIPVEYVLSLINGEIKQIHSGILRPILESAYSLGGEKNPQLMTQAILEKYSIGNQHLNSSQEKADIVEGHIHNLDPEIVNGIKRISGFVTTLCILLDDYGKRSIRRINDNITMDQGFYFAYMSLNLTPLNGKTKTTKQEFLNRLRGLINEFAEKDDSQGIEMYQ